MFTLSLKSEMTNVTGVTIPCHSPSQKPAGSPAPEAARSFAPGAQAARTRPPTATPSASSAVLNPSCPRLFLGPRVAPAGLGAGGWPSSSRALLSHPLHLPLDLLLADRRPVDVPGVEHQADAPGQHREHRPEEASPGQRPDDQQGAVAEQIREQVRAEVPLLPKTDGRLLAQLRLADGRPQLGHGCHLLPVTVPPPAAWRMSQKNPVRGSEGPIGCRWSRRWRAARPLADEERP